MIKDTQRWKMALICVIIEMNVTIRVLVRLRPETKEVSVGQNPEVNGRLISAICSFPMQDKTYLHLRTDYRHGLDSGLEQLLFFRRPHGIWNGKSPGLQQPLDRCWI
jgi:hypothetical protein